ncbi:MAG: Crp/Fnr family transcriptional regulator [Capnocytophaga sp.]|nr:Crp/Fnr family transcriptional regulator [Capnocytophaga sp.]
MQQTSFKIFLTSNIDIAEKALETILDNCQIRHFRKGEMLLTPGERCQHSFFVEKGLLKQYSIDSNGKEHILSFAPENWILSDRESVFFDLPARYHIQAIEDTEAFAFKETVVEEIAKEDPAIYPFLLRLLHNNIRSYQKRVNMLLAATAEERYLDFIKTYPDIMLRVPQIMVASYLGIAPESLSRVRKHLATKHKR